MTFYKSKTCKKVHRSSQLLASNFWGMTRISVSEKGISKDSFYFQWQSNIFWFSVLEINENKPDPVLKEFKKLANAWKPARTEKTNQAVNKTWWFSFTIFGKNVEFHSLSICEYTFHIRVEDVLRIESSWVCFYSITCSEYFFYSITSNCQPVLVFDTFHNFFQLWHVVMNFSIVHYGVYRKYDSWLDLRETIQNSLRTRKELYFHDRYA